MSAYQPKTAHITRSGNSVIAIMKAMHMRKVFMVHVGPFVLLASVRSPMSLCVSSRKPPRLNLPSVPLFYSKMLGAHPNCFRDHVLVPSRFDFGARDVSHAAICMIV